jgi:hypothetical protein
MIEQQVVKDCFVIRVEICHGGAPVASCLFASVFYTPIASGVMRARIHRCLVNRCFLKLACHGAATSVRRKASRESPNPAALVSLLIYACIGADLMDLLFVDDAL